MLGQNILLKRLENIAADRPLAVVVGSALSVTRREGLDPLGVPGVWGMVGMVREALSRVGAESELNAALANKPPADHYQAAFGLAEGVLGPRRVDDIVRAGVRRARRPDAPVDFDDDGAPSDWHIPRGTAALGRLLAAGAHPFTGPVLTTNFDPLISLAIKDAGATPERRILSKDGTLPAPAESEGRPRVVHLHGYWRGGPTLHTPRQLTRTRPALGGALRTLLRGHVVLVTAYGGWDDAFMQALAEVAAEPGDGVEVLWALYGGEADARHRNATLLERYEGAPGFMFYCGVDAHALFEALSPAPAARPTLPPAPADAIPTDDRPIEMGQPGFAVPPFTATPGTMIGGEPLIAALHAMLTSGGEAGIGQAAAVGLGGLGKSRLAWEYAHAHRDDYPGGVLWFDADPQSDLDGELADIARALRWVGEASDDKGALAVGRVALRELRHALIIFDNVEDLARVRHLRPETDCAFLVTSRQPQDMKVLDMKVLDPEAGVALLAQVSGRALDDPADQAAARAIAEWAEGLPLALELIGAYMARRSTATWAATLKRLEAHALKARPLKPGRGGLETPIHGGKSVEAALQLEPRLFEAHPTLARALDMLAGLAPSSMGIGLLSTLVAPDDPEDLTEALEVACTLRIVTRTAESPSRYRMHRLVRAVYRAGRDGTGLNAEVMARLIGWFRARRYWYSGVEAFIEESEHLIAARAAREALPESAELAELRWLEAHIAGTRGDYRAAAEEASRALAALPDGGDAGLRLRIGTLRASLQCNLGDVRAALEALEALIDRAEKTSGVSDVLVETLDALAYTRHQLGRKALAAEAAARCKALAEELYAADDWRLALAISGWAVMSALHDREAAEAAIGHAERAYELLRSRFGPASQFTSVAQSNFGVVLTAADQDRAALASDKDVLSTAQQAFGAQHPHTLAALRNLAVSYDNVGRHAEALKCAKHALNGLERLYSPRHPDAIDARVVGILSTVRPGAAAPARSQLQKLLAALPADHPQRGRLQTEINKLTPKRRRGKRRKKK